MLQPLSIFLNLALPSICLWQRESTAQSSSCNVGRTPGVGGDAIVLHQLIIKYAPLEDEWLQLGFHNTLGARQLHSVTPGWRQILAGDHRFGAGNAYGAIHGQMYGADGDCRFAAQALVADQFDNDVFGHVNSEGRRRFAGPPMLVSPTERVHCGRDAGYPAPPAA